MNAVDGLPKPVQRPGPPIMIGGGGRKVLSVAARQADIVQLMPSNPKGRSALDPSQFSEAAIEEKIGWIRDAAGSRFDDIELSAQLLACAVTDRADEHLSDFAERIAIVTERMGGARVDFGIDDLRRSPIVAVGPLDEVCEKLIATRDRLRHQLLRRTDRRPTRGPGTGDRAARRHVTMLADRAAVVAGGAGGLGGATVRRLAQLGAGVVILDPNDEGGSASRPSSTTVPPPSRATATTTSRSSPRSPPHDRWAPSRSRSAPRAS